MGKPFFVGRRPQRQPFDETLPDGTPAMMLGMRPRADMLMRTGEDSAPQSFGVPAQADARSDLSLPAIGPRPQMNPAQGDERPPEWDLGPLQSEDTSGMGPRPQLAPLVAVPPAQGPTTPDI